MYTILNCYEKLRENKDLNVKEIEKILNNKEIKSFQLASLAVQLLQKNPSYEEIDFLKKVFSSHPNIEKLT